MVHTAQQMYTYVHAIGTHAQTHTQYIQKPLMYSYRSLKKEGLLVKRGGGVVPGMYEE